MDRVRLASRAAAMTLAFLFSSAFAALPVHPVVQVLRPTDAEVSNGTTAPPNAYFGEAIAVYKSMALIGMPATSTGTVEQTGRVAVFTRQNGVWRRTGTFLSPAPRSGGHFGRLVALENDGALIADETRLYVLRYTQANGWKVVQWVHAPNSDGIVSYPDAVDFRCNSVAVAARTATANIVYLYDRGADGRLQFKARLTPPTHNINEEFGASLGIDCNLAVIGAPDLSYPTASSGSAYVYRKINGRWRYRQHVIPPDGAPRDRFGSAVAINHQIIFVGAPSASASIDLANGTGQVGAVYIFASTNGTYGLTDRLHPSADENDNYDDFGGHLRATDGRLFVQASELNFGVSLRTENLVFTYIRSGGTAQPVGIARGVVEGGDFFASGTRLFVGTPDDQRCFECIGKVAVYDITQTQ
ncbi:MAG TPA: hypothetical protein VFS24_16215 [Steroidobacteraceae bacterium]|nr:hypothetical protein [Steroidobacteraceae bacterium]